MLPRAAALVNALIVLSSVTACSARSSSSRESALSRETPAPREAGRRIGPDPRTLAPASLLANGLNEAMARGHLPPDPWARSFDDLPVALPARPRPAEELDLEPLGEAVLRASMDLELGGALEAYVDENVSGSDWRKYGLSALTYEEVWGPDGAGGLCEEGGILFEHETDDGETYEASFGAGTYAHFVGEPAAYWTELGAACQGSLADAAGDVSAAEDCDEYEEATFFPEGSDCRACLEELTGDFTACVDEGACQEEAVSKSWTIEDGEKVWLSTAFGYLWGCAPDLPVPTYIMADIEADGTLPSAFDHEAWRFYCVPYWDEAAGEPLFGCSAGDGGSKLGHTMGAGAVGRVNYIRPAGEEGDEHYDRLWYSSKVFFSDIDDITSYWATVPGSGQISMPAGDGERDPELDDSPLPDGGAAAWGLNPYALRPDGTDPTNIDHTFARDWLATLTLKTATTIDGIYIHTYNHNRCAAWEGPLEDGAWRCTSNRPPDVAWRDDAYVGWSTSIESPDADAASFHEIYAMPMATIASTGLPDPLVPGGQVTLIAGTANLADPDWEDCAWPHQFVPDVTPYEALPLSPGSEAWLWGDTWRFDKESELDLRVVLNTNDWRGFCPEG